MIILYFMEKNYLWLEEDYTVLDFTIKLLSC